MPRLQRFLYENGGPIILVQVENEYGVSKLYDKIYLNWLRDETGKSRSYLFLLHAFFVFFFLSLFFFVFCLFADK